MGTGLVSFALLIGFCGTTYGLFLLLFRKGKRIRGIKILVASPVLTIAAFMLIASQYDLEAERRAEKLEQRLAAGRDAKKEELAKAEAAKRDEEERIASERKAKEAGMIRPVLDTDHNLVTYVWSNATGMHVGQSRMRIDENWKMHHLLKVGLLCIAMDGADVKILGTDGTDALKITVTTAPDGKCVGATGVVPVGAVQPYDTWANERDVLPGMQEAPNG